MTYNVFFDIKGTADTDTIALMEFEFQQGATVMTTANAYVVGWSSFKIFPKKCIKSSTSYPYHVCQVLRNKKSHGNRLHYRPGSPLSSVDDTLVFQHYLKYANTDNTTAIV